jgi:hypothetical protein
MQDMKSIDLATSLALIASALAFCGYDRRFQKWHHPGWQPFAFIWGIHLR